MYFELVGIALDNFDIPAWAEKAQQRAVTVIRLVAQHTIEEKILRLHETKKELSDAILDGTDRSFSLTVDDVLDMVSPFR